MAERIWIPCKLHLKLQKKEKVENKPSLCVGRTLRKFTFWEEMLTVWYKDAIERFLKRGKRKRTGCFKTREDLNLFSKKMLPFSLRGRQWGSVGFCTNGTSRNSQGVSEHKLWLTLPLRLPCDVSACVGICPVWAFLTSQLLWASQP